MANSLSELRVLAVEDNFTALTLLRTMLADIGVNQVFTAKDGKEALDFLGAADDMIDIVLCDWKMPRMTGLDLLQQVRTVDPDIPFIMITGNADRESIMAAKNVGVTSYIAKPYSSKHLEKKLRALSRIVALRAEGKN